MTPNENTPPATPSGEVVDVDLLHEAYRAEHQGLLLRAEHAIARADAAEAERDALSRDIASYVQANADLLAKVERLEKALKPFAQKVDWPLTSILAGHPIQCRVIVPSFDTGGTPIASFGLFVGDFLCAAEAINKETSNG